jgi:hypothetical protein
MRFNSLLKQLQQYDIKVVIKNAIMEMLENDVSYLVLNEESWEVLKTFGKKYLGFSEMTIEAKVTAAIEELKKEKKIYCIDDKIYLYGTIKEVNNEEF